MNNSYKTTHTVKYSEVDSNYNMRLDWVVSDLQDITGLHSEEMGIDGPTLLEKSNAFWVLSKLKLKIKRMPRFDEHLEMETWPVTYGGACFGRDYAIYKEGEKIVMGTSKWCTLDYDAKTLRKGTSVCYPHDMLHREDRSGAGEFVRIKENVSDEDYNHTYCSAFIDIDTNKHTNNIAYLRMILNAFSPEEFSTMQMDEFQINFVSQTFYGDEIVIYKKKIDGGFYVKGEHDGRTVFNSLITLKKNV